MTIAQMANRLNSFVIIGYGDVSCIGIRHREGCTEDYTPIYEWEYLEDIEICDRDGHGGAGLNLIMEE